MLKESTLREVEILIERYPTLAQLKTPLVDCVELLKSAFENGDKLLACGNGGSAADSLHIVGELMKDFRMARPLPAELTANLRAQFPDEADYYAGNLQGALPVISLVSEISLTTAYGNDRASDLAFAQQVIGYGKPGDVLLAISTSGNSANVLHAVRIAKAMGLKIVSLTGETGGKLKELSDILINVPSKVTYQIQELHLPVYHMLCLALETELF